MTSDGEFAERLGSLLRSRRKAMGMSVDQVATAVGTTYVTLSSYERGEVVPRTDLLVRLAHVLKISELSLRDLGSYEWDLSSGLPRLQLVSQEPEPEEPKATRPQLGRIAGKARNRRKVVGDEGTPRSRSNRP